MTPRRTTLLLLSFAAVAGGAAAACLDLTPYLYVGAADSGSAPPEDAGADVALDAGVDGDAAVDVDNRPPCVRCLTTPDDASPPGCAAEIAACRTNTECAAVYECALANHCFEQPSFRDIVNCGLPCAAEAGIVTSTDPALTFIYDVAVCAQASCNGPCHIGDASIAGGP